MPVWHAFTEKRRGENFEHLSVAIDVQGPSVVKPWVAEVTHPVLVDRASALPGAFGFEVVPLWFLVDELGIVRACGTGGPNEKLFKQIDAFLTAPRSPLLPPRGAGGSEPPKPLDLEALQARTKAEDARAQDFANLAGALLARGEKERALAVLEIGFARFPSNWLLRKQRWALAHPEKFYEGKIDTAWQKEQVRAKR